MYRCLGGKGLLLGWWVQYAEVHALAHFKSLSRLRLARQACMPLCLPSLLQASRVVTSALLSAVQHQAHVVPGQSIQQPGKVIVLGMSQDHEVQAVIPVRHSLAQVLDNGQISVYTIRIRQVFAKVDLGILLYRIRYPLVPFRTSRPKRKRTAPGTPSLSQ